MKKIILSLTALLSIAFANAQSKSEGFSKGSFYLTGGIGFTSTDDQGTSASSFKFAPAASYFVSNNFAIGAKLGINSTKSTEYGVDVPQLGYLDFGGDALEVKENTTSFGVFGRYYFTPSSKFSVFGNAGLDYSSTKWTVDGSTADDKFNTIEFAVSPGVNYFLSNHFSMEAQFGKLGYSSAKWSTDGAKATSTFGLDLDLSTISFGLNYKF